MRSSLKTLAELLGAADPDELAWEELRYEDTSAVRNRLVERYAASTASRHLAALRGVLKQCWRLQLMSHADFARASDLEPPSPLDAAPQRALSAEEIRALVSACRDGTPSGSRDPALLLLMVSDLMVSTAVRRSEASQLELDDVDGDRVVVRHGKGGRRREVWLPPTAQCALLDWIRVSGDAKFLKLQEIVDDAKKRAEGGWIRARGVYQYFLAGSEGNDVVIFGPPENGSGARGAELARYTFPRQAEGDRLCLADYVAPLALGETDTVAMFVTSCGAGVRKLSQELKDNGEYVLSQTIQALAIESAEAFAEKVHHDLRLGWGIEDPPDFTMADIHKARYQGIRVSFGYPACPDLSDQAKLWKLLRPETVGVELTDGFMMDPEASVSALVFHHPQAKYFGVGVTEEELQPA